VSDGLLNESADRALRMIERDHAFHETKNRRMLEQARAYEGVLERSKPAAEWESNLHPPLINHAVETAMTMLVDGDIRFQVKPLPQEYKGTQWQDAVAGAKANEFRLRRQMGQSGDRFNEFLRPFVLTAAINRVAIAKTRWDNQTKKVKYLDNTRLLPLLGPLSPTRMTESEKMTTLFDGPRSEVVDLRDFYWPEAAVSLDVARYCAHAIWMTAGDLRQKAKDGIYDSKAVDALVAPNDNAGSNKNQQPDGNEIEMDRERRGRKNGLYEVLEIWDRDTDTLHVIGGRRTLLLQCDWPYWHQQFPFVSMSLAPFPFSIQGLSLVEKLAPLQDAYWDLLNQTFDNNKLINNAIIIMASDYDDPDAFEYAPGAVNTADRPDQVQMWSPNVQLAQVAAPLMAQLQGDLQNLAMGQPLSVPLSGRVTATEIATLSQIAQNAAQKMKDQVTYSLQRIGYQRMRLNQQYIRTTQHFIKRGPDGDPVPMSIDPHVFQGDYDFELTPSPDSAVRAERRAEAQSLMTLAIQAAAPLAMMGAPLNGKAFMDKVLDAFDVDDTDEFYSANPQPQGPPGAPPAAAAPPQGQGPGGAPQGVTGPQATSPVTSPSNANSLAGGVAMARAMAARGGVMGNTVAQGQQ
jgi:hypothetical protein